MKPENILFTDKTQTKVKIIDFGSSCTEYKNGFTYVQSRYYRAPEVLLGIPYDHAIDMWSFGLIIYELARVHPLYPARDEKDLLEMLRITLGKPSMSMLEKSKKLNQFYDETGRPYRSEKSKVPRDLPDMFRPIAEEIADEDSDFINFIERCLVLELADRMTPDEGLEHPWIKGAERIKS